MKTLAYAKAFQYWAERTKPLILGNPCQLVGSILELRQSIEPFTTFKDSKVLSNNTAPWGHDVCCSHGAFLRGSFSVASSRRQPGPSIGLITQTSMLATPLGETLLQCAVPTNQPSTGLPGLEENAREPPWVTTLLTPLMEVEEVTEAEEVVALVTLGWTQIHPYRVVVPHSLHDEWHCCHSHSHHSWRRAHLQAEKNQQIGNPNDFVPGSPVTTCNSSPLATSSPSMETLMEGTIIWLWVPLLGFTDIANTLQRSQSPETLLEPTEEHSPTPVVGSSLFISQMIQDAWGNLSVDMVTCQLSVMGMGSTPWWQLVRCPPSRMLPNLTRWSSAGKNLSGMYTHIALSSVVVCPQFCAELCFPWCFCPKILICLCSYLTFTKRVLL